MEIPIFAVMAKQKAKKKRIPGSAGLTSVASWCLQFHQVYPCTHKTKIKIKYIYFFITNLPRSSLNPPLFDLLKSVNAFSSYNKTNKQADRHGPFYNIDIDFAINQQTGPENLSY